MPLWFNKKINLTPVEIIYGAREATSLSTMAPVLGVSRWTIKLYAEQHVHPDTGENLYEWLKNTFKENKIRRKSERKKHESTSIRLTAYDIISGKNPNISKDKLREVLIRDGIFEEKCNICGFEERRVIDYQVPLVMLWKDGNFKNHAMDNLELICYNCYFLNYSEFEMKTAAPISRKMYKLKN